MRLCPNVGHRFSVVQWLQIEPTADPLRQALHLWRGQNLFQLSRTGQQDMDGGHRRKDVREQPQFFDEPRGQCIGFVYEHHKPRTRCC